MHGSSDSLCEVLGSKAQTSRHEVSGKGSPMAVVLIIHINRDMALTQRAGSHDQVVRIELRSITISFKGEGAQILVHVVIETSSTVLQAMSLKSRVRCYIRRLR